MRHASFFSGVGGLDLGFEISGIETVSVSEIDPYANAVLAERFPDAPNLGSITEVEANDIPEADIWSGGFPCQDLSVAGKRAGFAGKRSSLAFTFLDLVEQRRPRWLVLENVPGLFSSNKGADFGRLLNEMEQLGYGVSWRTLDARYFGVAQRRRRVFLVASLESDRAAEVLLECEGCERHPSPRWTQRQGVAGGAPDGSGIAGAITRRFSKGVNSTIDEPLIVSTLQARMGKGRGPSVNTDEAAGGQLIVVSPTLDPDGVRAADGLARRMDNKQEVDDPQRVGCFEMWDFPEDSINPSLNALRARDQIAYTLTSPTGGGRRDKIPMTTSNATVGGTAEEDDLLPVGLDSHRYRCCGNGVVAPVAEWIGRRIVEVDRRWREEEAK